jgi:hypothetical protein
VIRGVAFSFAIKYLVLHGFNQRTFAKIRGQFPSVAIRLPSQKNIWPADSRESSQIFGSMDNNSPSTERRRLATIRFNSRDSRSGFLFRDQETPA